MQSLINLIDEPTSQAVEILQLYEGLELLRLGEPPCHSIFVLGREPDSTTTDRLLIIDPPPDLNTRFRVQGDVAGLSTHQAVDPSDPAANEAADLPYLETQPGGTAHIRLGRHFLDIHTQRRYALVHFPALGIICGGPFGSNNLPPRLAHDDDGSDALDTLILLARLVKSRPLQLYIPAMGELGRETVAVMEHLAADVAYLHHLRRIAPALKNNAPAKLDAVAATLLPAARRTAEAEAINRHNLHTILRNF